MSEEQLVFISPEYAELERETVLDGRDAIPDDYIEALKLFTECVGERAAVGTVGEAIYYHIAGCLFCQERGFLHNEAMRNVRRLEKN